jgi:hypothetical protein
VEQRRDRSAAPDTPHLGQGRGFELQQEIRAPPGVLTVGDTRSGPRVGVVGDAQAAACSGLDLQVADLT